MTGTVLSPHRDDAALSAAMTIAALAGNGGVRVMNCFTVSDYAPYAEARGTDEIVALRRREDLECLSRIGRGIDVLDLGELDAPIRLGCPVSAVRRRRFGAVEREQAGRIAEKLADEPGLLLVPLGLGSHIDHLIAREAGIVLARAGRAVGFYEDLPYAAELRECCILSAAHSVSRRLGENLTGALIGGPDELRAKPLAIGAYATQLSVRQMDSVTEYAQLHGARERVWMTRRLLNQFPIAIGGIEPATSSPAARVSRALTCLTHQSGRRWKAVVGRLPWTTSRGEVNNVRQIT
jgi:LmbE family N-acetylglucosaminyl deacetylase